MTCRVHLLLPLAALLLTGVLLWPSPDSDARGDARSEAPGRGAVEARDLLAAPGAPTLAGRAVESKRAHGGAAAERADAVITVVGPIEAGASESSPLEGAAVRIRDGRAPSRSAWHLTDSAGRVHLVDVRLDGSVRAEVVTLEGTRVLGRAVVTAAEVTLPCTAGLPIRAAIVDAQTGRALPTVPWHPDPELAAGPPSAPEGPWRTSAAAPGTRARIGLELGRPVPRSHVAWDPACHPTLVSRYARALALVHPLRREARVHVRAEEADGTLARRARVEAFSIAGRHGDSGVEAIPDRGGFLVRGLPYFRDEPLAILVVRPPDPALEEEECSEEVCEDWEEVNETDGECVIDDGSETYVGAAIGKGRLPSRWEDLAVVTATFPEDPEASVLWGGEGAFSFRSSCRRRLRAALAHGSVELTVQRRDGRPAVAARVWLGRHRLRTDLAGRVRFEQVGVGERQALLCEPGLVRTGLDLTVRDGETTRAVLREAQGAQVRVRVVDAEGEGLPFARLEVDPGALWIDLEDGVQRVDTFTDTHGRRRLAHMPSGTWTLRARWASRKGEVRLEVREGEVYEVTLRVE